ncbi:hypothetical protein PAXRUDRAFT_771730, partial [Paxillus rubicundulus Ve08.2h10]
ILTSSVLPTSALKLTEGCDEKGLKFLTSICITCQCNRNTKFILFLATHLFRGKTPIRG